MNYAHDEDCFWRSQSKRNFDLLTEAIKERNELRQQAQSSEPAQVDLFDVKAAAKRKFGALDGVEGFGIGDGTLRIYVRNSGLGRALPRRFQGVDVDLVVTGDITTQRP